MANNARYDYHSPEQTAPASPYGSGDPYYNKSSGYIASGAAPAKSSKRNWLKIGIPIAILVIVGAVVGGVLGSRKSKKNSNSNGDSSNNNNGNGNSNGGPNNGLARLPTSTDPFYGMPIYPSSVSPPPFSVDRGNISAYLCLVLPFSPLLHWMIDVSRLLPSSATRPTPPSTASRRSRPTPSFLGRAIHSAPLTHHPRVYAQTVLA